MSFGAFLEDAATYVGGSFTGAPSENDWFQNVLAKTGDFAVQNTLNHYGAKSAQPAQVAKPANPLGAAANQSATAPMSATMKAVLTVGGIVLGVVAITLLLSMLKRKG